MSTYIIHYPTGTTSFGSKTNNVITCNSIDMLQTELSKVVTKDNLNQIKVIKIHHDRTYVYVFAKDGMCLSSDPGVLLIETPEIYKKLNPSSIQNYLMIFGDSCQSYDYEGLKNMISMLVNIPPEWKIITQPDCTVYTYEPKENLFTSSNGSTLPRELTSHLETFYKLVFHFYSNDMTTTHQKEMCQEKFYSRTKSFDNIQTYLMHLFSSRKLQYIPNEFNNLYRIDIMCNNDKLGEINEVGLYYNNLIVSNSIGEPYESFKTIMKSTKDKLNFLESKKTLLQKLEEFRDLTCKTADNAKTALIQCQDTNMIDVWTKTFNNFGF